MCNDIFLTWFFPLIQSTRLTKCLFLPDKHLIKYFKWYAGYQRRTHWANVWSWFSFVFLWQQLVRHQRKIRNKEAGNEWTDNLADVEGHLKNEATGGIRTLSCGVSTSPRFSRLHRYTVTRVLKYLHLKRSLEFVALKPGLGVDKKPHLRKICF